MAEAGRLGGHCWLPAAGIRWSWGVGEGGLPVAVRLPETVACIIRGASASERLTHRQLSRCPAGTADLTGPRAKGSWGSLHGGFVFFELSDEFHSCPRWSQVRLLQNVKRLAGVQVHREELDGFMCISFHFRVVSTCHSLVVGILGLYIFFFDEATFADPLW